MKKYFYSDTYIEVTTSWAELHSDALGRIVYQMSNSVQETTEKLNNLSLAKSDPEWIQKFAELPIESSSIQSCEYSEFAYTDSDTGEETLGDGEEIDSFEFPDDDFSEVEFSLADVKNLDREINPPTCDESACEKTKFVYARDYDEMMAKLELDLSLSDSEFSNYLEMAQGFFHNLTLSEVDFQSATFSFWPKDYSQESNSSIGCSKCISGYEDYFGDTDESYEELLIRCINEIAILPMVFKVDYLVSIISEYIELMNLDKPKVYRDVSSIQGSSDALKKILEFLSN